MIHQINKATDYLKQRGFGQAEIGIVLGTGLSKLLEKIEVEYKINYHDIPHFPVATMEFHAGHLVLGRCNGKKMIVMQGRFHYYEGYSMKQITFPIRVMKMLGIKKLFLSNAAGGINLNYKKGDLIIIEDHINLQPENPLTGANYETIGHRFPDMSMPYDKQLRDLFKKSANKTNVDIKEGVYVSVSGPNLETRAEYRYLKIIGADMVGMSTVPEVIVANHMKLPCMAVSVITDECNPDNLQPIDIREIIKIAQHSDEKLSEIFVQMISLL